MGKKEQSLNWDDFKKLGNPDAVPDEVVEESASGIAFSSLSVRVHIQRKGGGKIVSIVKGLHIFEKDLINISKELKKTCGVGGSCKNKEIIIQGDKRDKIIEFLKKKGVKDIKKSGG